MICRLKKRSEIICKLLIKNDKKISKNAIFSERFLAMKSYKHCILLIYAKILPLDLFQFYSLFSIIYNRIFEKRSEKTESVPKSFIT